jgi:hypothetical protein
MDPSEIEADFVQSWNNVAQFFNWILAPLPWKDEVMQFLALLRAAGYDRKFRAGQSLDMLVLSRARVHGLRQGQSAVVFVFHQGGMEVLVDHKKIDSIPIELTPKVEGVLAELLSKPID